MTQTVDYIQQYMRPEPIRVGRAALLLIDMQFATGSRRGALARKHLQTPEGNPDLAYRFDRIETLVVPHQQQLMAGFRKAGGRVIHVRIGPQLRDASDAPVHMRPLFLATENWVGSPDHEGLPELAPEPEDILLRKTTIGAFASTGIDSLLRGMGIEHLAVTGISTNMCVETTAREAADRGYRVTLVEDACGTTHRELHESTMRNFARLFGRVRMTADVLAEVAAG